MVKQRWSCVGMIRRKKKVERKNRLAEGILLSNRFYEQKENRKVTLLIKAIMVYLLVEGSLGGMLSAFEIQCEMLVLHIVIFLGAWYCACLYYRKKWENIGYILLFFLMLGVGIPLHRYINSGFFGVVNDISRQATSFFGSNAVRSYKEQISNHSLAITIAMSYIGVICCIITNILVSRKMRYVSVILLGMGSLLLPAYLNHEPAGIYVVFLITGLVMTFLMRGNGHYGLKAEDCSYRYEEKKSHITYQYHRQSFAGILCLVFGIVMAGTILWSVVYPKEKFQAAHTMSNWKADTMDIMENIYLRGLAGLMSFYPNTGGMNSGELGRVSSVRFDYDPDLTVEFVPYSYDRIYLKTFTGADYYPYENQWNRGGVLEQKEADSCDTACRLQKRYEKKEKDSAKGVMYITNEAAAIGGYRPYYTICTEAAIIEQEVEYDYYATGTEAAITEQGIVYDEIMPGETRSYTYYPMLIGNLEGDAEALISEAWLRIPKVNENVIAEFCKEAGFSGDKKKIESELRQYFQEHYPYTLRPGKTPKGKDFINYFLAENKKGYCTHFASAAVLIYRYMGIPARYVEGYAIDAEEIAEDGEVLRDKKIKDYYDGDMKIGESGVVSVAATDADAHAWVEIYDEKTGWQVSEVTPYSTEQESEGGLWNLFMGLFNGGDSSDSTKQSEENGTNTVVAQITKVSGLGMKIGVIVFALLVLVYFGIREGKKIHCYLTGNRSEKLMIRYRRFIHRVSRKDKELKMQKNYEEQITYLAGTGMLKLSKEDMEECVRILNKAGFSGKELTETEYLWIKEWVL